MMDRLTRCWDVLGDLLHDRPVQFFSYLIAAMCVAVALSFALAASHDNSAEIERVKEALCTPTHQGGNVNYARCQLLLNRLLRHPTHRQIQRIQQIVVEGR